MNVVRRAVAAVSLGLLTVGVQLAVQADAAVAAGVPTEVRVVPGDVPTYPASIAIRIARIQRLDRSQWYRDSARLPQARELLLRRR